MKIKSIFLKKYNKNIMHEIIENNTINKSKYSDVFYILACSVCYLASNSAAYTSDQASALLGSFLQKPAAPAPTVAAPAPVTVPVTIPVPVTVRVPYTVPVTVPAPASTTAATTISTSGMANGQQPRSQQYPQQGYNNQQQSQNGQYQQGYNGRQDYNSQSGQSQSYNNQQQGYNSQQGQSQQGQSQNNYNNSQVPWSQQPQQQGYDNQQPWSSQPQQQSYAQQQGYVQPGSAQNNYNSSQSSWSQPQQQGYSNQQSWAQQPQQQGYIQSSPTQSNYGAQSSWSIQPQQPNYSSQQPWSFSPSMLPTASASSTSTSSTTKPASTTSSASGFGMSSMMQPQGYMNQNNMMMGQSAYNQSFSPMPLMPARLDSTQNIDQQVQKQMNNLAEELSGYKIFTEKLATDADSAATQSANVTAKAIVEAANLALSAESLQSNIRHKEQRVLMALENAMRIANEANFVVQSSTTATKEEKEFSKARLTSLENTYKSMQKASITASESAGAIKNSAHAAMFAKSIFKPIFEATEAARKAKEASQNMLIAAKTAETDGPSASYDLKNSEMLVSATRDCPGKPKGDCERRTKHCEWKETTGCQFKCEAVTVKSLCLGISNETKCQWESSIDMCRTK